MADLSPIGGDLQNVDNLAAPAEFEQHDSKYNIQLQETDEDLQNKLQQLFDKRDQPELELEDEFPNDYEENFNQNLGQSQDDL